MRDRRIANAVPTNMQTNIPVMNAAQTMMTLRIVGVADTSMRTVVPLAEDARETSDGPSMGRPTVMSSWWVTLTRVWAGSCA